MVFPPATILIKCDLQTDISGKWFDFVDGGNGCIYGIPWNARRVLQFHVEDKSMKEIGPDLGDNVGKYGNGIKANNGNIYCLPYAAEHLLKIIPGEDQTADVQILQEIEIPRGSWDDGALANDDCIYYLPFREKSHILKLNPNDGDSLCLVGENIDGGFTAAVLGKDGCINGISLRRIMKFDPTDHSVSNVGCNFESYHLWTAFVMTEDGNIYAANKKGQILRIDTTANDWTIIGNEIYKGSGFGWGNPVLGANKCIYFPPARHDRVLKLNPSTQNTSMIGKSCVKKVHHWLSSVLASDGFIYCVPYSAENILQIDSRHVNEQVLSMIEDLEGSDNNTVEGDSVV